MNSKLNQRLNEPKRRAAMLVMIRQFFVTLLSCLLLPLGAAAVSATVNADSVSAVNYSDTSNIVLFAGFAGDIGGCDSSSVSTSSVCDSCSALNLCSGSSTKYYQCAQRSIHRELLLTIVMKVDSVPTSPTLKVYWKDSSQEITPVTAPDSGSIQANQAFTVQLRWGDLCTKAGFNDDCTYTNTLGVEASKGVAETLTVGVTDGGTSFATGTSQKFTVRLTYAKPDDSSSLVPTPVQPSNSGDSFTDFKVLPGDGKVFVSDIWRGSTGPSASGIKWNALRVYYSTFAAPVSPALPAPDFCNIDYSSSDYTDLLVEDKSNVETTLSDNKIDGLVNEELYMFNIATVDEATVVSGFIDPAALTALGDDEKTRYYAQPGEVIGLLENKGCFIATAAFGSPMQPQVELLRKFRNQVLLPSQWGRQFVKFYYQNSPPVAQFISENEFLRAAVRVALWPVILFAELTLKFGFFLTFGLFSVALGSLILVATRFRRTI